MRVLILKNWQKKAKTSLAYCNNVQNKGIKIIRIPKSIKKTSNLCDLWFANSSPLIVQFGPSESRTRLILSISNVLNQISGCMGINIICLLFSNASSMTFLISVNFLENRPYSWSCYRRRPYLIQLFRFYTPTKQCLED